MERRKLTKEDIDKVRDVEGFPLGTDEDIIALSDAPYYTACPNPFIKEFVEEYGHPYDEATDDYHREPYTEDVSSNKSNSIYKAHAYHTKVPHEAIMQYILHYTEPGDIVLDGFCGTGMTGVAAQMCGTPSPEFRRKYEEHHKEVTWGARKAIMNDLSPAATFISYNYNAAIDTGAFEREMDQLLDSVECELGWMYKTTAVGSAAKDNATINYTLWSDVFICPNCGHEIVFYDIALDNEGNMQPILHCDKCGVEIKKSKCKRAIDVRMDRETGKIQKFAKQIPVLINYSFGNKRYNKTPDKMDLGRIDKITQDGINEYWYPTDELIKGEKTADPINIGITSVNLFYTVRNLYALSAIWNRAGKSEYKNQIRFCLTAILMKTASRLHNVGFKKGKINLAGAMPNALFIPSILAERNIFQLVRKKIADILPVYSLKKDNQNYMVSCGSSTDLSSIPSNSIDYIFVDPPFGSNLMYSELSFIWEAWLKILTNNGKEAIISRPQKKGLSEYQTLFYQCFSEFYRCLKPNRWITIEFHNKNNSVWTAINEAIQRAGFIISYVKTIDKGQGSYNQQIATGSVKQDLAISAYKPTLGFIKSFERKIGDPAMVWEFIRQHLRNLPVAPDGDHDGKIDIVSERQNYLLYDRMVAWHLMHGVSVPMDATEFYRGLDEHFMKRDDMYFLPDQVNEYDQKRSVMELENIEMAFAIQDEKGAIQWLNYQLTEPQTYQDLQPKYLQELHQLRSEKMPELMDLLRENFLQDEDGKWYVPDITKAGDVAKLRQKSLLKEFESYLQMKGKLKVFRSEAIRAGFDKLWKEQDYKTIVSVAERLPEKTIQEDANLLMYYDLSTSRV